ncbi:hypothetical protein OF83DRAFT_1176423 [Amylostereum chailletii]|nr:hypothetical protein OF83DRAFT_1176423 [Amylostereum chailletii]
MSPRVFYIDCVRRSHVADDLLAVYVLGGSPELINIIYDAHEKQQVLLPKVEVEITDDNFLDHRLFDHKFYQAYRVYFSNYLLEHSPTEALERFVFSNEFNYLPSLDKVNAEAVRNGKPGTKKQPEMLNRLLAGLLHPLIRIGYGVEFGIPALVADGLAQTAVHIEHQSEVIPHSFFTPSPAVDHLFRGFSKLDINDSAPLDKSDRLPFFKFHQALLDDPTLEASGLNLTPESYFHFKGFGVQKLFWTPGHAYDVGANPWARLWTNTLVHPNEHLHKLVQACGACANWYGELEAEYFSEAEGALRRISVVDGTLPLRVASITMERIGWAYEGGELRQWDRDAGL